MLYQELPPKVSVIMSVYNQETYLKDAIESILNQTFTDFEFIIINDGSTDKTKEIIENYQKLDSRIKIINQKNQGLTKSLNKGIFVSQGEYIARMDADDISLPQRIEKQAIFLDSHPDVGMVGVWAELFSDNIPCITKSCFVSDFEKISEYLVSTGNCFVHSSVMVRADIIKKLGGYDERLVKSQDYELWLRLIAVSKVAIIPEILHRHRIATNSVSEKYAFETAKTNWLVKKAYHFRQQGKQDGLGEAIIEYKKRKKELNHLFTYKQYHILGRRASLQGDFKKAMLLYLKGISLKPFKLKLWINLLCIPINFLQIFFKRRRTLHSFTRY